jgi:zinc D-Ala-D-Ala carboxypeptidase
VGNLSPNFTLAELTRSETAKRYQIDNIPNAGGIAKLTRVCNEILEPVRLYYRKPVTVNSGYRSPVLNRRIPGSSNTSQHTLCEAVDFEVEGVSNYEVAKWIKDGGIKSFGQLILEFYVPGNPSSGWVHCSLPSASNRNEVLTAIRRNGRTRYVKGLVL